MHEPEAEIRALRHELAAAVDRGDTETVARFLAPEFVLRSRGGWVVRDRKRVLKGSRLMQRLQGHRHRIEIERVELDGDVARLTVLRVATFGLLGPRKTAFRQSETWKRGADGWQLSEAVTVDAPVPDVPSEVAPAAAPGGRGDEPAAAG